MVLNNSEIKRLIQILGQTSYRPLLGSDAALWDKLKLLALNLGPVSRGEVYVAIDSERCHQENLGPDRTDGREHEVEGYLVMLRYYLRKAENVWTRNVNDPTVLDEIRKIAAIAIQCMEKHGAPLRRS